MIDGISMQNKTQKSRGPALLYEAKRFPGTFHS